MDFQSGILQKLIIHYTGNKGTADALQLSAKALALEEEMREVLGQSFLGRFKNNQEWYAFSHGSSLQYNEVYNYCKSIFAADRSFEESSRAIATHLYEQSIHPRIKGGELYVAYFDAVPVESRMCKAIGLFKSENKSFFLETEQQREGISLRVKEGIEVAKIDKGCLVIEQNEEDGYHVLIFDNQNRGEEAQYWKEKFLSVEPRKNEFHTTQHFLSLTKQFITGPLESEWNVDRKEQVELLHKSIDYFKSREQFDIDEFQSEVFGNDERINAFRHFGSRYIESNDFDLASQFEISHDAVKKQSRIFKSVLKLDKNFHIYIHGRTDLIERGVDGDGRKFYKIYYQDEM